MKKQTQIPKLSLLTALSGIVLLGCKEDPNYQQNCVNDAGVVVDEKNCQGDAQHHPGFLWYYGGSRLFYPGQRALGGTYAPRSGTSYFHPGTSSGSGSHVSSSPITRGGFGSTGHGSFGAGS